MVVMDGPNFKANTGTEKNINIDLNIDTLVSEIQSTVKYTDDHFKDYPLFHDGSADPWGQYNTGLHQEAFWKNKGIVVRNSIFNCDFDGVWCYHSNPDINPGAKNGNNPEDSMIFVNAGLFMGHDDPYDEYELYLHKGKVIQVMKDGFVLKSYSNGEEIRNVYDEYKDDWGRLLRLAFPRALGVNTASSWESITVQFKDRNDDMFDGTEFILRACYRNYVLDDDTILETSNEDFFLPYHEDDDTAVQWFARYLNTKYAGYDNYFVKLTENHIDKILRVYWWS